MVSLRRVLVASVGLLLASPLFIFAFPLVKTIRTADRVRLELKACGTKADEVDYETRTDKAIIRPRALGGQGAGLRTRPTMMGIGSKVSWPSTAVEGRESRQQLFLLCASTGAHYFCSSTDNYSVLQLEVEAGKTYYCSSMCGWARKNSTAS